MPNGQIQQEFTDTLASIGLWMKKYGQSIYQTRGNAAAPQPWGVVTAKSNTWYVHVLTKTKLPFILIPSVKQKITKATLLNSGKNISYKQQPEGVFVYLDDVNMDDIDTIIQLEIK